MRDRKAIVVGTKQDLRHWRDLPQCFEIDWIVGLCHLKIELAKFCLDTVGEQFAQTLRTNCGPIRESCDAAEEQRHHAAAMAEDEPHVWKLPQVTAHHQTQDGACSIHRPFNPRTANRWLLVTERAGSAANGVVGM